MIITKDWIGGLKNQQPLSKLVSKWFNLLNHMWWLVEFFVVVVNLLFFHHLLKVMSYKNYAGYLLLKKSKFAPSFNHVTSSQSALPSNLPTLVLHQIERGGLVTTDYGWLLKHSTFICLVTTHGIPLLVAMY